jgi:hypothetical protein
MKGFAFAGALLVAALTGIAASDHAPRSSPPLERAHPTAKPTSCVHSRHAEATTSPSLGRGTGVWASVGGQLMLAGGVAPRVSEEAAQGIVRHVSTTPGVGTTYVIDRHGGDVVVAVTGSGVIRVPQIEEATHPTLSRRGTLMWTIAGAVRVRDGATGRIRDIAIPRDGSTMFSPLFVSEGTIAAVVSAQPIDDPVEGTVEDNLFTTPIGRRAWRPVTSFRMHGDHWVAIRTPYRRPDGSIEFVRVTADASETVEPRFELWRVTRAGGARRIRSLPREMYLAGYQGDTRLWNAPSPTGSARLLAQAPGGRLTAIGCGSVALDPVDAVDPDLRKHGTLVPPRVDHPGLDAVAPAPTIPEIAILVGDFADRTGAELVAGEIGEAYPELQVDVVDASTAPLAIRPGVWGAILRLPGDVDATASLSEFRRRLPAYAANSWVVTP